MQRGLITYWNDVKGYGFITAAGTGREYFFHHSSFVKGHRPIIRYRVLFEIAPGRRPGTQQAVNVRLMDMTPNAPISSAVVAGFENALKNAGDTEVSS